MTTEVAMEWDVTSWIRMVKMLLQLTDTSGAMLPAIVTERASGKLMAKEIAGATETANVTLTVKATVEKTGKAIERQLGR